ncbi:MAG: phosphoribosyl-AMP cyclohydrolase [Spirochaetaceae bacterium]|nr:MAG: phosphoribosyl-AMP cyclohydrolase [Spirochaetaceae bacterium]
MSLGESEKVNPERKLAPDFSKLNGLVAAIAQDAATGEVLMLGFQDQEAWEASLRTGFAHYHSRSRGRLWKKGESSGNVQRIIEIRLDCDQDAVLMIVEQQGGVACHTGRRSCFFNKVEGANLVVSESPAGSGL